MKQKITSLILISTVLLAGLLSGCTKRAEEIIFEPEVVTPGEIATEVVAESTSEGAPVDRSFTVIDALGRSVSFEKQPEKIIIIGKATTMLNNTIFLFPEAPERVISYEQRLQMDVDFITTIFEEMANKTLVDRDATAEQVAPLNPDLVILKTYMRDKVGLPIETIGIPVVYLDLESPEQFYIDLRTIGQIFGNSARAEQLVTLYKANEARISEALSGLSDDAKPSALMLEYKNKGGEVAFAVPPVDYLQTLIVEKAGGNPVWKEVITNGGWTVVTLEQIAAWNPDMIFLVDYNGNAAEVISGLKQDVKWQALKAVINGKLYAFPVDFLSWDQPDPRWGLGELWLASKIHPERFPAFNMEDEVVSFYTDYYGLDVTIITEIILPLLAGDL